MKTTLTLVLFIPLLCAAQLSYPVAKTVDQVDTYFGKKVADPYRWLEDPSDPDTQHWAHAEDSLTSAYMDKIPYHGGILNHLKATFRYAEYTAPFSCGGYEYYRKKDSGKEHAVFYRRKGADSVPELVLDPNILSSDHTTNVKFFELSKDGSYAAYALAEKGSDWCVVHVMDMKTLKTTSEQISWVKASDIAWQGNGFYYCQYAAPASGRELLDVGKQHKVHYHHIGSEIPDSVIYYDPSAPDQLYGIKTSEDERYTFLTKSKPGYGNALWYRERGQTDFIPIVRAIGTSGFHFVCADSSSFIISTGAGTRYGKLMLHDIKSGVDKEFIPETKDPIHDISTTGGKIFITYMHDVSDLVVIYNMKGEKEGEVQLPGLGTVAGFDGQSGDTVAYYAFTSYTRPASLYRYNIATHVSTPYRLSDIGFDASLYEAKQVFFHSSDGFKIPMYIISRTDLDMSEPHPLILYGYGGFGISESPIFRPLMMPFLDAGGIYVVANIRGGGEYGGYWHMMGSRLNKVNSFKDFIGAASYLIQHKYTDKDHLAIEGGSNGGLLVAACVNMRPDLFKVAISEVPVTDMLRFQKYTAGVHWTTEYGSSDYEESFKVLHGYSPLHNIKKGKSYPAMLVTTATNDDRVVPAHSYKYVAALQAIAGPSTSSPLLLRIVKNSGHSSSNFSKYTEEMADIYSFIFYNMGITPSFKMALKK